MAVATDALSGLLTDVFATCAIFSGLFLLFASVDSLFHGHFGHHGHAGSASHGGSALHGHGPHGHAGHSHLGYGHASHTHIGHAHAANGHAAHTHGGHAHAANGHIGHGHVGQDLHSGAGAHAHGDANGSAHHGLQGAKAGPHLHADASGTHAPADASANGHHGPGEAGSGAGRSGGDTRGGRDRLAILVSGGHSVWAGFAALVMGSLSVYGLLSLLFFTGIAGLLLGTLAPVPRVTLALVIGVAAALACGAMLDRLMGDTAGEITEESTRIEGREVRVTRGIRPAGTGEAIFALNGGVYQNIPVRSLDGGAIRTGQIVVVVEVRRGIALVEPLGYGADDGLELESTEGEEPSSSPSPGSP